MFFRCDVLRKVVWVPSVTSGVTRVAQGRVRSGLFTEPRERSRPTSSSARRKSVLFMEEGWVCTATNGTPGPSRPTATTRVCAVAPPSVVRFRNNRSELPKFRRRRRGGSLTLGRLVLILGLPSGSSGLLFRRSSYTDSVLVHSVIVSLEGFWGERMSCQVK